VTEVQVTGAGVALISERLGVTKITTPSSGSSAPPRTGRMHAATL
jgi:hypothetical protein